MADAEQRLFAFGPFGVSVCEGPWGLFRWRWQNATRIELTDRGIRGIASGAFVFLRLRPRGGDPSFAISYAAIVAAQLRRQPAGFGLMQVLDIKYREAEQVREQSIASFRGRMTKAFVILQRNAPQLG